MEKCGGFRVYLPPLIRKIGKNKQTNRWIITIVFLLMSSFQRVLLFIIEGMFIYFPERFTRHNIIGLLDDFIIKLGNKSIQCMRLVISLFILYGVYDDDDYYYYSRHNHPRCAESTSCLSTGYYYYSGEIRLAAKKTL